MMFRETVANGGITWTPGQGLHIDEDLVEITDAKKEKYGFGYDDVHNMTRADYPDHSYKALTYNKESDPRWSLAWVKSDERASVVIDELWRGSMVCLLHLSVGAGISSSLEMPKHRVSRTHGPHLQGSTNLHSHS